jgi:hypothetical protein
MALNLLEASGRHFVEVDVTNYGATIDGLGETNWLRVVALLDKIMRAGLQINLPTFNAASATLTKRCCLAIHLDSDGIKFGWS